MKIQAIRITGIYVFVLMLSCSYALAEYTANPAFPAYSDGGSSDSNEQRIEMRCIIDGNKGTFYIANTGPISFVPGTLYFTEESLTGNIVKQVEINDYPGSLKVELNFDHKDSKKYYARYVYASTGFAVWTGAIEVTAEITNVYLKYHRFTHMWPHILNQWYFYEPLYIDIDNKGNIFIADNGIKKFSGNGSFLSQWNHYGGAIAISKDNEVFVANNKTIQKFSHDSSFLSEFHIQLRLGDDSNITISEITVDKDGSVYVVLGSHDRVQQYALEDGQYKLKIEWGERGSNELQFNKPDGIAVFENINGTKYIVVTDSGNHRVQVFERNNDEEIIFIKSWGKNGSNPGEFKYPGAIAVDSYGQIYIGDTTKRIQVFDIDGNLIKEWWKANSLLVPFQRITDICANNKYVYFSDKGNAIYQYSLSGQFISCWDNKTDDYNLQKTNDLVVNSEKDMFIVDNEKHEIVRLDQTGKQINKWGQYGKNDEEFKYPRNIAIDKNENIYVTSSHKVQKFRPDGTFIWSRGSNGNDNEQFDFPCGIATDNEYIYIADRHNHRIQKMDFSGNFILSWGLQGYENGQFREPLAVAVDKNSGNIYVADSGNFRVQIFTSTGEYINQFGQEGEGEGEFSKPCDIVIAENSAVYVVDSVLNHIQKFEPDGTFITKIGMQGYFKSYFQQPCGLALHEDGTVYVAETINNRIQAFTPVTEALPDKAIILMGRKSSKDSLKDESKKCANYAYSALIQRGFTRETISFLSDNEPFDLDNNGSIDEKSARTEKWIQDNYDDYGLANAFMASGVSAYIGSHWDINDESGRLFAQEFYKNIMFGCSVGKSIKNTRLKLQQSVTDIDWAAYVLYGDPSLTFITDSDNSNITTKFSDQTQLQTNQPKKEKFSLNMIKELRNWFTAIIVFIICGAGLLFMHNHFTKDELIKVKKILITIANQKQQRINSLFKELADIGVPAKKSSKEKLNIELLVDSKHENTATEDMILAVIQNKFVRHPGYRIIESSGQSLDKVLETLVNRLRLPGKKQSIEFSMPDIIIFIALYNCGSKSIVLLRPVLANNQNLMHENIFVELDNSISIRSQKDKLTKKLSEVLSYKN